MCIDEIFKVMDYLHNQISEIGNYPEKSLFFQDPRISEAWLHLVGLLEEFENYSSLQHRDSTETKVLHILSLRMVKIKYRELYEAYYHQLKELLDGYGGWLSGECLSKDGMDMLSDERFTKYMGEVGEAENYLAMLNSKAPEVRSAMFTMLSDILNIMLAVAKRGQQLISERFPTLDDFVKALDDDLRAFTKENKEAMLREMVEDLNRHYKNKRTDPNLPELWGEMLSEDEDALMLAKKQKLSKCETARQEHWGEAGKKEMDENGELMGRIYEMCYTNKLIDLKNPDNVQGILPLLNYRNIEMFYKKIIRRNLIQCEMFPRLKAQYDEWLNYEKEEEEVVENVEDANMNRSRMSKLDEIINIMQKGNWKKPATARNIECFLNAVFGRDISLLENIDSLQCERMWALVEGGRGDRMTVMPANLAGFFSQENLLGGSPKEISNELFGVNSDQCNNINKGKSKNCSNDFAKVVPFLKKYTKKLILQECNDF